MEIYEWKKNNDNDEKKAEKIGEEKTINNT